MTMESRVKHLAIVAALWLTAPVTVPLATGVATGFAMGVYSIISGTTDANGNSQTVVAFKAAGVIGFTVWAMTYEWIKPVAWPWTTEKACGQ
jgi:hypothetical protein